MLGSIFFCLLVLLFRQILVRYNGLVIANNIFFSDLVILAKLMLCIWGLSVYYLYVTLKRNISLV